MTRSKSVTFIIPCLNGEQYINRCLESFLKLPFKDWEAIIVDNGSDDQSYILLSSYAKKDNRFIILTSKKKCQSTAKNIAIKNASGKYVCFVDIDDSISENFFEAYPIEKNCDFYFSNWVKFKDDKSSILKMPVNSGCLSRDDLIRIQKWIFGDVQSKNALTIDVFSSNCGKLYKTSIIRENNISFIPIEKIGGSEDAIFNMEYLSFAQSGYFSEEGLYHYFSHPDSFTHKRDLSSLYLYYSQYHIMEDLIDKLGLNSEYRIALKNRLIIVSLPVFIVASRLNVSKKEKYNFFKKYLSYKEFDDCVNYFKKNKFGLPFKILYSLLIKKHYKMLYYLLKVMDKIYAR